MKTKFLILGLIISITGCDKEDDAIVGNQLNGKWIEMSLRQDTLTFDTSQNILQLDRGLELIDGNLLPKFGSGTYEYKLKRSDISLRSMLSSNANFNDYSFEVVTDTLRIQNFYNSDTQSSFFGEIVNYEKLE